MLATIATYVLNVLHWLDAHGLVPWVITTCAWLANVITPGTLLSKAVHYVGGNGPKIQKAIADAETALSVVK